MDSIFPNHAEDVRDDFFALVSERCLPPDLIPKVVILSQGALWKYRMIREPPVLHREDDSLVPSPSETVAIESRILTHVLVLHEALLQVGIAQLAEAPPEESDLAQRITATFRRTLPALRIASKWLTANVKYVFQCYDSDTIRTSLKPSPRKRKDVHTADLATGISQFWRTYSQFSTDLRNMFPPERLPRLNTPLEEDVDMKGFLPLRNMMGDVKGVERKTDRSTDVGDANLTGQVHPNEEQLMRIADLLNDFKTLKESAELEASLLFPV
jgi:protein SMG7